MAVLPNPESTTLHRRLCVKWSEMGREPSEESEVRDVSQGKGNSNSLAMCVRIYVCVVVVWGVGSS